MIYSILQKQLSVVESIRVVIDRLRPVAILDGRDGTTLKEWLKNNQHIKAVTRDRASAYAKVISEEFLLRHIMFRKLLNRLFHLSLLIQELPCSHWLTNILSTQ